ncbi:alpha-ketoglutarate-dependent dioxygenase AlkB family protein [Mariniflexile gromovii]|uniref:Alpha-ketoglutarate-dependent dioxygenase AlkB n=1 Tax=Mariniflexile gromovii TaxID=362523 RepID=A0ABS4BRG9_9FLAO|nr:alpha-ketoglutarate-dependent dioxygenase AlkB [Mariniflexile gromovii]MBP0903173.1 alpha-ketoglutarate-dependent dioxygenase AlkB [Mariniflexile gromovii]
MEEVNILPFDGEAYYYGKMLSNKSAINYFNRLMHTIPWEHDKISMFGKLIITKRKVAWYGDKPFGYTYSKTTKYALPWTLELLDLKKLIERKTGETFNSCLLNLYHNGEEGMGWHSDNEKDLIKNASIGSLSLGAERMFSFKHKKTKKLVSLYLENGSLLLMKGTTQTNWLHRLPSTKNVNAPRINLTFRNMIEDI